MSAGRVLTWTGAAGGFLALLCCVTPILPAALGALGLGGLTAALWRDAVLLPVAGAMFAVMGLGLWLTRRT